MSRELRPCGTWAAYMRHVRAGEDPCEACREAARSKSRQEWHRRSLKVKPCGTYAAYMRHRKAGEKPCKPCRRASVEYMTEYKARKRAQVPELRLPARAPEGAHRAPCFGNPALWDPQGDGESKDAARVRWREAARLCVTACPVFEHCRESHELAAGGGVWAGRIPGRSS